MPYIGTKAKTFNTFTSADVKVTDDLTVTDDASIGGALSAKGGAVFNEDSADVDFRVESNGNANMLFVDGGNNVVGIGANNNTSYDSIAQTLLVANESGHAGITIRGGGTNPFNGIHFSDGVSDNSEKRAGRIMYQHEHDVMTLQTANAERMRISSEGYVTQNNLPFVFVNGNDTNVRTLANGNVFFNTNNGSQAAASVTGSSTVTGAGNSGITYTSSNGRFTVPVAGRYFISGRFRYAETGDEAVSVTINTNGNQDVAYKILQCTEATTLIITACAVLAANDFIHFQHGSGADRGFFMANGHCGASIFLIG